MYWNCYLKFGGSRRSSHPPVINVVVGLGMLGGLIPWLFIDGSFTLIARNFRLSEQTLTVDTSLVFFYGLIIFSIILGVVSLLGAYSGYKSNCRAEKLNKGSHSDFDLPPL